MEQWIRNGIRLSAALAGRRPHVFSGMVGSGSNVGSGRNGANWDKIQIACLQLYLSIL
jgi:hypothetical protein